MINEDSLKTVEESEELVDNTDTLLDPLLKEQKSQAEQMRAALLNCRKGDLTSAKVALQNIAILQVYHQVARIIRYTEMMDRIEDKLYASIDMNLAEMDECDPATMLMLLKVQSQLQNAMIESQKLLEPYMNIDLESIAPPQEIDDSTSFGVAIIPKESRNAIRNGAQALLTELRKDEISSNEADQTETKSKRKYRRKSNSIINNSDVKNEANETIVHKKSSRGF
jgi:hypothetical protein